ARNRPLLLARSRVGNVIARETGVPSNARDATARTFIVRADEEYASTPSQFFHSIRIDATTATRGFTSGALCKRIKNRAWRIDRECKAAPDQVNFGSAIRIAVVFPLAQAFRVRVRTRSGSDRIIKFRGIVGSPSLRSDVLTRVL